MLFSRSFYSKNLFLPSASAYWFFYSETELLLKEGHFLNGKADNWWIIYEIAADKTHKAKFKKNKKKGYCVK